MTKLINFDLLYNNPKFLNLPAFAQKILIDLIAFDDNGGFGSIPLMNLYSVNKTEIEKIQTTIDILDKAGWITISKQFPDRYYLGSVYYRITQGDKGLSAKQGFHISIMRKIFNQYHLFDQAVFNDLANVQINNPEEIHEIFRDCQTMKDIIELCLNNNFSSLKEVASGTQGGSKGGSQGAITNGSEGGL